MTQRIWLDCTSLMNWNLRHLTGIQRSVIGIYKGWKACGLEPRLFYYSERLNCFLEVTPEDLPEIVRLNFQHRSWTALKPVPMSVFHEPESDAPRKADHRRPASLWITRLRISLRQWLIGTGPAADELHAAIRDLKLVGRRFLSAACRWVRSEISHRRKPAHAPILMDSMVGRHDYLFSLGSECFHVPSAIKAAARLRKQGATLIRMVYDVIPASQPQWVPAAASDSFIDAISIVLRGSDCLLTISEYSRQDIERFAAKASITLPRLKVLRLADEFEISSQDLCWQPESYRRPRQPFFLCVGSVEPRKNHHLLYRTWRRLAHEAPSECPDLVCIGKHQETCRQLIHEFRCDPIVRDRVLLLTEIEDYQLNWYYENCLATLFPSLYEGWGLPVAESLARGKLCLTSNATSMVEISDFALFFDPEDPVVLSNLILRTLRDQAWREAMETRIRLGYKTTSWKQTALSVLKAIAS